MNRTVDLVYFNAGGGHRASALALQQVIEVSYAIAEQARGRGYGAEAVLAACHWATAAFGLRRIVALTASANLPSRLTLAAAGFALAGSEVFRFQGVEQDVCRYVWAVAREATQIEKPFTPVCLCPPSQLVELLRAAQARGS